MSEGQTVPGGSGWSVRKTTRRSARAERAYSTWIGFPAGQPLATVMLRLRSDTDGSRSSVQPATSRPATCSLRSQAPYPLVDHFPSRSWASVKRVTRPGRGPHPNSTSRALSKRRRQPRRAEGARLRARAAGSVPFSAPLGARSAERGNGGPPSQASFVRGSSGRTGTSGAAPASLLAATAPTIATPARGRTAQPPSCSAPISGCSTLSAACSTSSRL